MKRISFLLIGNLLFCDTKIVPFAVLKHYENRSFIKSSELRGFLYSNKNFEFSFSKTAGEFKKKFGKFYQNDYTLLLKNRNIKYGIHFTDTKNYENEMIFIAEISKNLQKNKISTQFFYTFSKSKNIFQLSPYFENYYFIKTNIINYFRFFIDFIRYKDNFLAAGFKNTIFYKKFYFSFEFEGGELIEYIKDNGHSVYNTQDRVKKIFTLSFGYKNLNLSFKRKYFKEYLGYNTSNKIFSISYTKKF